MSCRAAHRFFWLLSIYSLNIVSDQPWQCLMVFKHKKINVHVAILWKYQAWWKFIPNCKWKFNSDLQYQIFTLFQIVMISDMDLEVVYFLVHKTHHLLWISKMIVQTFHLKIVWRKLSSTIFEDTQASTFGNVGSW